MEKESINAKEFLDLLEEAKKSRVSTVDVLLEVKHMGVNPTLLYVIQDHEDIEIDKRKLMVFRMKYGV